MNIQLFQMTPAYVATKQTQIKQDASHMTEQSQNKKQTEQFSQKVSNAASAPEQKQQTSTNRSDSLQQDTTKEPNKEVNFYGHEIERDIFGRKIERDAFGNKIERDVFGREIKQNELEEESQKTNDIKEKKEEEKDIFGHEKCETCSKRKYQDVSNDPSVSFQTPTALSPERAAAAVRSHEMEHVFHEQVRAKKEGREVVSQTVTYSTGICPECHRLYISGGETRTVTKARPEKFHIGLEKEMQKGKYFDAVA